MLTVLTIIPIVALLICLIVLKLPVTKSGAIALGLALVIAVGFFGITGFGLAVASGKALWLALFVSLIVWCALFLYHLVSDFGAIDVINKNISVLVKDEFVAFLLLAWLFTGMLQGIAGFGIPSVIVAPILIALGFNPVKSLSAVLIGHSWAVTFGSMGAAFFVIQGITKIPPDELGFPVWVFNTVTILMTGIGVCFVHGGFKSIVKGLGYVIPAAAVMSGMQFLLVRLGMYALGTLVTALSGLVTLFALYKIRSKDETDEKIVLYKGKLNLLQSAFPYALIMLLLVLFQLIPIQIRNTIALSFDFPATATTLEIPHVVAPEPNFNPIRLFAHPFVVLLIAAGVACAIYKKAGVWDSSVFKNSISKTVKKGVPATLALLAFGNMSLIMMDSGMMVYLAGKVADLTGNLYPIFAPFIGVTATFLTGNNTNSNVMFGEFQRAVAYNLGLSQAVMSAAQSIAGGLGCAIGSTIVFMAALATKQTDKVPFILKKLIPLVLIIAGIMGIVNFILINNYPIMKELS